MVWAGSSHRGLRGNFPENGWAAVLSHRGSWLMATGDIRTEIPEKSRFREATAEAIQPWVVVPCGDPPVPARGHDCLGQPRMCVPHGIDGAAAARARALPYGLNGECAASQASRAVSSIRALRPRCTTGSWPVHSSLANVSGLTPNHRCASSRGISCGGTGSSRGRSCCRGDERGRARGRLGAGGMAGGSPLKSRVGKTGEPCAPQTRTG
jgi:hypothetical protein